MRLHGLVFPLLMATPTLAQVSHDPDDRFRTIEYSGRIVQITATPTTTQTLLFARGERIQSVILSNPGAFTVNVSATGDSLVLKANDRIVATMMSIRTEWRSYELELVAGQEGSIPQIVRFSYPSGAADSPQQSSSPPAVEGVSYRFSGAKTIRPSSISDDGRKTYISWKEDQAMPAIFARGPGGKEEMVDGYMRAGIFTIDRVYDALVFRIDREEAVARRRVRVAEVK